jgi:hypothetical protein
MPPLEQTASPWSPTCSQSGSIQRTGRPVTNTTVTPSDSTAVSAARVRSVTVPSVCSSVPSRSVATSFSTTRGYRPGRSISDVAGANPARS